MHKSILLMFDENSLSKTKPKMCEQFKYHVHFNIYLSVVKMKTKLSFIFSVNSSLRNRYDIYHSMLKAQKH